MILKFNNNYMIFSYFLLLHERFIFDKKVSHLQIIILRSNQGGLLRLA